MGLKDVLPNDSADDSETNSLKTSTSSASDDEPTVIGDGDQQRKYTPLKWKRVKRVVHEEMGLSMQHVLDKPPEERNQILDEAEHWYSDDFSNSESEYRSQTRCAVCNKACDSHNVEIQGKKFCIQHTAGQISKELNNT